MGEESEFYDVPPPDWNRVVCLARAEVKSVLEGLPKPLRERAQSLPVVYEHVPSQELVDDGLDADLMGLFVGSAFDEEETSLSPIPAQIILFLDNIWDVAEGDQDTFCSEVRITLMHELGHYLGLNEDDLFERGLD